MARLKGEEVDITKMIILHTNFGDISLELDHEKAPKTAANFEQYVSEGFYDGVIFHRVINGFMIQGGGFEPGMVQKTTRETIENEADNGLSNANGTIAMARTMDPHSASAQFFINVADNTFLDHTAKTTEGWGYAVFGKVVDGHGRWSIRSRQPPQRCVLAIRMYLLKTSLSNLQKLLLKQKKWKATDE